MTVQFDQLHACRYYKPLSVGRLSDGSTVPVLVDTCSGCGGTEWLGPSCWCPQFGEQEDDE